MKLRALLAVALVLLPVAPMEVIGSGVDTPWYLLLSCSGRCCGGRGHGPRWRWRRRSGSSRWLPYPGRAARTAACRATVRAAPSTGARGERGLAGRRLVQAAFVIPLALHGRSRLHLNSLTPPGQSLAFYGHVVLLPSLGWHTSWWPRSFAGANGAAAIAAVVLAVSFGLILVTQPGARLFVVTALAVGFIFTVISVSINRAPATNRCFPRRCSAPGTRSWLTS